MIHAPTEVMVIVGRLQVDGVADLPAVHALQDQFTLTVRRCVGHRLAGIPVVALTGVPDDLVWWDRLRVALAAYPPPPGDAPFLARLERLGLTGAESPYVDPDPALATVLRAGAEQGKAMIEQLAGLAALGMAAAGPVPRTTSTTTSTSSRSARSTSPEWKIEDRSKAAVTGAVAALVRVSGATTVTRPATT